MSFGVPLLESEFPSYPQDGRPQCEEYPGIGPPRQTLEPLPASADVGAIGLASPRTQSPAKRDAFPGKHSRVPGQGTVQGYLAHKKTPTP
jgi:hypothetical protein